MSHIPRYYNGPFHEHTCYLYNFMFFSISK